MDGTLSEAGKILLSLGFPGVVILGLCYAAYNLNKRNETLTERLITLYADNTATFKVMATLLEERLPRRRAD
jgi:hypothetical protein